MAYYALIEEILCNIRWFVMGALRKKINWCDNSMESLQAPIKQNHLTQMNYAFILKVDHC